MELPVSMLEKCATGQSRICGFEEDLGSNPSAATNFFLFLLLDVRGKEKVEWSFVSCHGWLVH